MNRRELMRSVGALALGSQLPAVSLAESSKTIPDLTTSNWTMTILNQDGDVVLGPVMCCFYPSTVVPNMGYMIGVFHVDKQTPTYRSYMVRLECRDFGYSTKFTLDFLSNSSFEGCFLMVHKAMSIA